MFKSPLQMCENVRGDFICVSVMSETEYSGTVVYGFLTIEKFELYKIKNAPPGYCCTLSRSSKTPR
jgi:hypothetical protein